jgi:hypothetical protein
MNSYFRQLQIAKSFSCADILVEWTHICVDVEETLRGNGTHPPRFLCDFILLSKLLWDGSNCVHKSNTIINNPQTYFCFVPSLIDLLKATLLLKCVCPTSIAMSRVPSRLIQPKDVLLHKEGSLAQQNFWPFRWIAKKNITDTLDELLKETGADNNWYLWPEFWHQRQL